MKVLVYIMIVFCLTIFLVTRVDYISHFKLVKQSRLDGYLQAFAVVDEDENGVISIDVRKCFYLKMYGFMK